jgi:hypothetical protein
VLPAALHLAGGALAVVGSFLPWVTVTTIFGTLSLGGMEGDGVIAAVAGGALCLIGIVGLSSGKPLLMGGLVLSLALAGLGIFEAIQIGSGTSDISAEAAGLARASIGLGVWVLIAGSALGASAFLAKSKR